MKSLRSYLSKIVQSRTATSGKKVRHLQTIQYLVIVLVIVLVAFLALYWAGNGFSLSDNVIGASNDFRISIDSPGQGSTFTQADTINVRGGSLGGTLSRVILWDQAYNVGIPCNVVATTFAVQIDASELSPGDHTLVLQAQSTDGRWSHPASVDISIVAASSSTSPTYTEVEGTETPGIFKPIYDIVDGISIQVEEGTGDNDLNGDNIDDRLQSSPLSPRYNAFNLPLMMIIIVIIIAVVIGLILYTYLKYVRIEKGTKIQLTRYMGETPERRSWYLRLRSMEPEVVEAKYSQLRQKEKKLKHAYEQFKDRHQSLINQQQQLQRQLAEQSRKGNEQTSAHIASKIYEVERKVADLNQRYAQKIRQEKMQQQRLRQSFSQLINKLRKERDEIAKQKSVKIFIGEKKKKVQTKRSPIQFMPRMRR